MATITGSLAAPKILGGWRAYVTYTVDSATNPAQTTVTVSDMHFKPVWSGVEFDWPSSTNAQTLTVGSNTATGYLNWGYSDYYWYTSNSFTTKRSYTFTYNKTHAAQTKSIAFSVKVGQGWELVEPGGSDPISINGTASVATISVSVPALPSYAISLDLDGGSGAGTSLTKWYGESLTLPQPSKNYYSFAGWALTSAPTTVVYQPGAAYTVNEAASLIAVWVPTIQGVYITDVQTQRCNAQGIALDDGEFVHVTATWRVDGAANTVVTAYASMSDATSSIVWTGTPSQTTKTGNDYLEGVSEWITTEVANADEQYSVEVSISESFNSLTDYRISIVATAFFTIDILAGGHGIAFGKPANTEHLFEVDNMDVNFEQDVEIGGSLTINNTPILELVYPVGAIYMSTVSTSPAVLFGGTWERMTQRFLLGADDSGTSAANQNSTAVVGAGGTGGQAGVTLTTNQIPSHTHDITYAQYNRGTGSSTTSALQYTGSTKTTEATGGGQSHNNMPPFIAVYMWKRTA